MLILLECQLKQTNAQMMDLFLWNPPPPPSHDIPQMYSFATHVDASCLLTTIILHTLAIGKPL